MGKKRIVKKGSSEESVKKSSKKLPRRKLDKGILHVQSTYNNTRVALTDTKGNLIISSSSGSLGFKGAKKGTPFAAAKVGEILADKAEQLNLREIDVMIKGVGSGRESAVRSFVSKGIQINSIKDKTPVPHNGPTIRKPRRV